MEFEISFYGPLVQPAGGRRRMVRVEGERPTVGDLRAAIASEIPAVAPHLKHVAIGMGSELYGDDAFLRADQEIALLPPVSGG